MLSKPEAEDIWQDQHDCGADQNRKYTYYFFFSKPEAEDVR